MIFKEDKFEHISPVTLKFTHKETEKMYQQKYRETFLTSNKLCLLLGILLYAIFGFIDFFYNSEPSSIYQTIRYGFTLPMTGLLFLISIFYKKIVNSHVFFSIGLSFFAISILIINIISAGKADSIYIMGFVILFFFGQNFLKITFIRSTFILFIIVCIYEYVTLFFFNIKFEIFTVISFFVIISFLLSSFSAYYFELVDRNNFWNMLQLENTNNAFQELKFELEQKVSNRTEELEKVIKELEHAKVKAEESNIIKSSFLATISHEIRTPLTSILGFSQLIIKSTKNNEKAQVYGKNIENSIAELLEIITNILTLSEIHNNRIEKSTCIIDFSIFEIEIQKIVDEILQKRNKNLPFTFSCEEPISLQVAIGEKELKIVLKQLLENAVKYTGNGEFGINCEVNESGMFQFCVFDTGIGINNENLHSIFDFFRQEDQIDSRMYNGIGVGLSICKGIISKCGGAIWAESEKNKGSRFYVTLPILYKSENNEL
jgi:signal transduction histidine kinase